MCLFTLVYFDFFEGTGWFWLRFNFLPSLPPPFCLSVCISPYFFLRVYLDLLLPTSPYYFKTALPFGSVMEFPVLFDSGFMPFCHSTSCRLAQLLDVEQLGFLHPLFIYLFFSCVPWIPCSKSRTSSALVRSQVCLLLVSVQKPEVWLCSDHACVGNCSPLHVGNQQSLP